ncbi:MULTISPECIES: DUF3093 domain-containing protein [Cryobacterium]|uniref:Membrane protein n=1 Tax=Cryobacterium arcticum TaxID=670052 RepID=A0A1B1BQB9_9MICO|nr:MULTISPECIES: DUF3093 domain-containing protein [Cryobacterium]ANP74842.1 Membrane protein [Cryobacterium arcticum]MBX0301396.1 DUF3093 domain-containing protein [Cryobacterium sp. 1639]
MYYHRERLWPSPSIFIFTALVIPASLLVFLPINPTVGVLTAAVLYTGIIAVLVLASPTIAVTDSYLIAGPARLPIEHIGTPQVFLAEQATLERGQRLDARAWLLLRGWVSPVIKIPLTDPEDPAPYWLLSTRHPQRVADALLKSASAATTPDVT